MSACVCGSLCSCARLCASVCVRVFAQAYVRMCAPLHNVIELGLGRGDARMRMSHLECI